MPTRLARGPTLPPRRVPPSIDESTGQPIPLGLPRGGEPGQHPAAFNSMTLQSAPLLPNGTTWMSVNNTDEHGPLGQGELTLRPAGPGPEGRAAWTGSSACPCLHGHPNNCRPTPLHPAHPPRRPVPEPGSHAAWRRAR